MRTAYLVALALLAPIIAEPAIAAPLQAQDVPKATPESVGMSSERLERLDRAIQRYVDEDLIAGTVALVARSGRVVHLSAQGDRYKELGDAMETGDIFYIQSMTKSIVSTALMILFEEGYFLLDDPISKYLPGFEHKTVVRRTPQGVIREPAERPITFRHVLTHTSGVDPDRSLLTDAERDLLRPRATIEETIMARAPLPLAFQPGDEWQYGSSTDYVALLVEKISGQPLDRFLDDRIFGPLGMVDTGYNVPPSKKDRIAGVYDPSGPEMSVELRLAPGERGPTTLFRGVAGLYSTAADYFRFAQMILDGGELNGVRILSPTTVNLMVSNHVGDKLVGAGRNTPGYGFGLSFSMVTDVATAREALTPGSFGWWGVWNTSYWVDPTEELVMILLMQLTSYRHIEIRREFPGLVIQAITESYHSGPGAIKAYPAIRR
jgi:CubicO group peptidase (beta-lactamase class C family)